MVIVCSDEFRDGAEVQARALGVTPTALYTQHPIRDRTDAEMAGIADDSVEAIVAALIAAGDAGAAG